MHSDILFSIIMPTYNRASLLPRAVNSVLAQNYKNFELIIVDDGSTDNTKEVVQGYSDFRIRYYKKENEERSIARNYGIRQSRGQYVNFLDSDDIFYSNHLEEADKLIKLKSSPELAHMSYELVDKNGDTLHQQNNFENIADKLIRENILHGNAIFIRKDILSEYSFIPDRRAVISEDWYLWLRLISRFPFYTSPVVTSAIIEHEQRSLREVSPDKLIRSTQVIIDYLNRDKVFLKKYGKQVRYFYANMYTLVTLVLALSKNRKQEVLYYLCKALQWDWRVVVRRRFLASIKHLF